MTRRDFDELEKPKNKKKAQFEKSKKEKKQATN